MRRLDYITIKALEALVSRVTSIIQRLSRTGQDQEECIRKALIIARNNMIPKLRAYPIGPRRVKVIPRFKIYSFLRDHFSENDHFSKNETSSYFVTKSVPLKPISWLPVYCL